MFSFKPGVAALFGSYFRKTDILNFFASFIRNIIIDGETERWKSSLDKHMPILLAFEELWLSEVQNGPSQINAN